MNKMNAYMYSVAVFTFVRSFYNACTIISAIIRHARGAYLVALMLYLVFLIFENYFVFSCLVKKKKYLTIEIEFTIICLFYIFSLGYALSANPYVGMANIILTILYVLCIEGFKILYIKKNK